MLSTPTAYVHAEPVVEVIKEVVEEVFVYNVYASCITTARLLGVDLPKGDAKDLVPNSTPVIGGIILFKYGEVYHVAVIKGFLQDGFWVSEGNYKAGQFTQRMIAYNDSFIRGFASY